MKKLVFLILTLTIVKHVAPVHHAEPSLQSAEGQGTTMSIQF